MKKPWLITFAGFLGVLVLLGGAKVMQVRAAMAAGQKSAPPPPTVEVARVERMTWQPTLRAVGTLRSEHGVTLSTDLPGIVAAIEFESGQAVRKGQVLVRLDTRQEEAQLRVAEARRDLARANWERQQQLRESGVSATADWESAESEYRQAVAAVEEVRVLLARKQLVAPFDGVTGLREVHLGQYLNPGVPVVRLESLDPIRVEFAVPQSDLQRVTVGAPLRVRVDGRDDEEFTGHVMALDSRVDPSSRNIRVEGSVPNREGKLRPGMYVQVDVLQPATEVLAVPATAIQHAPYGDSVFTVQSSGTVAVVQQRFVKCGESRGNLVEVRAGVNEGEWVVTAGGFKVRPGMVVQPTSPAPSPAPTTPALLPNG